MKIIFFGTPDYVLPVLDVLNKYHEIVAVVTQPPRPMGREQKLSYSAVDIWAHKKKIEKQFDFSNLPEADMGICAAYGQIIPKSVLNHFKYGILNIHPSILPKYRGASPIQTAITNGETETGVSIIKMDEKMDHGPVITQFKEEIFSDDTFESLRSRLFEKSAAVLVELFDPYIKGKIKLKPQDHEQATFTKIVSREDGFVDLKKDKPTIVEQKIRAYTPWPGAWTKVDEKRLKILKAHLEDEKLVIDEIQLAGKNPVSWKQFKEAYPSLLSKLK